MTDLIEPLNLRHWTDFPKVPDTYEVAWHGWKSLLPTYMTWDGEAWVDLDVKRKYYKVALSKLHADMGIYYPGDFFWYPKKPWDIRE